jgi:O-methyltransferase involved in polyketide biosynthesis
VPEDGPALVIGEGLFMYLAEDDGKRLIRRVTGHFSSGEMVFDAFSRAWIRLERFNRLIRAEGGVHWGIDDPGELEREPPLRCVSAVSAFAIPGTERLHGPYRTIFRAFAAVPSLNRAFRLLRYRW